MWAKKTVRAPANFEKADAFVKDYYAIVNAVECRVVIDPEFDKMVCELLYGWIDKIERVADPKLYEISVRVRLCLDLTRYISNCRTFTNDPSTQPGILLQTVEFILSSLDIGTALEEDFAFPSSLFNSNESICQISLSEDISQTYGEVLISMFEELLMKAVINDLTLTIYKFPSNKKDVLKPVK